MMLMTTASRLLKPYVCNFPHCFKRYKNLNGLKYHMEKSHGFSKTDSNQLATAIVKLTNLEYGINARSVSSNVLLAAIKEKEEQGRPASTAAPPGNVLRQPVVIAPPRFIPGQAQQATATVAQGLAPASAQTLTAPSPPTVSAPAPAASAAGTMQRALSQTAPSVPQPQHVPTGASSSCVSSVQATMSSTSDPITLPTANPARLPHAGNMANIAAMYANMTPLQQANFSQAYIQILAASGLIDLKKHPNGAALLQRASSQLAALKQQQQQQPVQTVASVSNAQQSVSIVQAAVQQQQFQTSIGFQQPCLHLPHEDLPVAHRPANVVHVAPQQPAVTPPTLSQTPPFQHPQQP